jgi:2,4-dienoyl-CoA reductase-like NADH-dependent reductase (Old Yellow Enzyme family)
VFHGDAPLGGWQGVIDAVHAAGGKMGPQIWHTGGVPSSDGAFARTALDTPSGLNAPGQAVGEPMSEEAIADTVAAFARAAADAKALGFDTFEIHGAHGYLIDQFFWPDTNLRTDRYGGATISRALTLRRRSRRPRRAQRWDRTIRSCCASASGSSRTTPRGWRRRRRKWSNGSARWSMPGSTCCTARSGATGSPSSPRSTASTD